MKALIVGLALGAALATGLAVSDFGKHPVAEPEMYLTTHWPSRTLTLTQVTQAIGDADSMRVVTLKDVDGKPYLELVSRWEAGNGSVIESDRKGIVDLVIPNLREAEAEYRQWKAR
jgi:hypothetical protein